MTDPRAKYEAALAAFAQRGGRWENKGALTYWGKACGLTAEEIIADVRAAGVADRDADIRRGWADAPTHGAANHAPRARKVAAQTPPRYAGHVRAMIGDLNHAAASATADWVRELSPCLDWVGKPPQVQTAVFLRTAFRPDERLHIFRDDQPTVGVPWENIRCAEDWAERIAADPLPGDLIVPNPLTGKQGETTAGKPSYIAQSCLAATPFVVLEMDDARFAFGKQGDTAKGLALQCAFWRGFIQKSNIAPALVSLTYSGGKSIHGLLHVGAANLADWNAARARLAALFASDPTAVTDADGKTRRPFRVDVQAMTPRQGTRLPGVRRFDNGKGQVLLYLNPQARVA